MSHLGVFGREEDTITCEEDTLACGTLIITHIVILNGLRSYRLQSGEA